MAKLDMEIPEIDRARTSAMVKTGLFTPFRCKTAGGLALSSLLDC
jgi:hypothetical protein